MGSHAFSMNFLRLPGEIQQSIINQLKTTSPLFIPQYCFKAFGSRSILDMNHLFCDLPRKGREYYGTPTENQVACSNGLLALSMTCKSLHSLVAPHVYETVLLHNNIKSMESVIALSKSKHWKHVKHVIVVNFGAYRHEEDIAGDEILDNNSPGPVEKIEAEMSALRTILSNLPPDLTTLTLDFPQDWAEFEEYNISYTWDSEELERDEKSNRFLAWLNTMFDTVATNDFAERAFELKLHNLPPLRCSAWERPQFSKFLECITSLTVSLCNYHDEDENLNSMESVSDLGDFLSYMEDCFFLHLLNVKTFKLHADCSWPLGSSDDLSPFVLPFPVPISSNIEDISLQQIFIGYNLIEFLRIYAKNLVSLKLADCYAHRMDPDDEADFDVVDDNIDYLTWADLFNTLAEAEPNNLTTIRVTNPSQKPSELLKQDEGDNRMLLASNVEHVAQVLHSQSEEETRQCDVKLDEEIAWMQRKQIFSYAFLKNSSGFLRNDAVTNVARFLSGEDHEACVGLGEIVQGNIQRKKIMANSPPPRVL